MYTYTETNYKGYTIKIQSDDDPLNPITDFDMLGKIVCWHRRYNLGHEQPKESPAMWLFNLACDYYDYDYVSNKWDYANSHEEEFNKMLELCEKHFIFLPVFMYEHSGITINTRGFSDSWDSGQLGFVYISLDDVRKNWGKKRISKALRQRVIKALESCVQGYDDFLTGNVWGYVVEDSDEEHIDSCWGFYGDEGRDYAMQEAKSIIDYEIKHANDEKWTVYAEHEKELVYIM